MSLSPKSLNPSQQCIPQRIQVFFFFFDIIGFQVKEIAFGEWFFALILTFFDFCFISK